MSEIENPMQSDAPAYGAPRVPETQPEEPARLGPLQRLTGVMFSPGETFVDVNRKPTVLAPILIAIATVIVSTLFFNWWVNPNWDQILRPQVKKRIEKGGQTATEEQIQQGVSIGKTFAKFTPIIAACVVPIFYIVLAGIFALGMVFIQAKTTFRKILSVVSWSGVVTALITTIVTIIALLVQSKESLANIDPTKSTGVIPTNVAAFLPSDSSPAILAIASSLDIFSIWFMILLAIGLAAVAGARKITTGKTGGMIFGLWAIFILIKVAWASIFG